MKKQYIQRPGINPKTNLPYEQVELAKTGYATLQEASDIAGYAPVATPEDTSLLPPGEEDAGLDDFTIDDLAVSDEELPTITDEDEDVISSDAFATREDFETRVISERERLETAREAARAAKRAEISGRFDPVIEKAEEFVIDIGEATRGRFATKRRLSTAALSFVDFRVKEATGKVEDLEKQKQIALDSLDVKLAENLEKDLKEFKESERFWIKRKDDLAKETFDRWLATEKLDVTKDVAAISEAREARLASSDLRTRTLDNIASLAESNIQLDQIAEEERDEFELRAGIPVGSFEAIFTNLQAAKEAERFGDEIKLHQSLSNLLDDTPPGTEILIGNDIYKGRKTPDVTIITKEDASGNVTSVGLDKETGEELYRVNLGNIGKGLKTPTAGVTFKIPAGAKNKMIAAGVSLDDIIALETNLKNGHSIDDIFGAEGTTMTTEQQTVIRNSLSGITPKISTFTEIDDDEFTLAYLAGYADEDGEVDVKSFLSKENADVILEAKKRGMLDSDDEETRGFIGTQINRIQKGYEVFTGIFK